MDKRDFILDKQGQAFTLDVMLALVIITIIIGISADAIDIASYKATDYSARFSLERVTNDAADMLIKTSGSPNDWEFGVNINTAPGLASIDHRTGKVIPNTLSMGKINALRENYNPLIYGRALPRGLNSSLMIYPSNPSLSPIVIMNNSPENTVEVAVSNRTVVFKPLEDIKAVICNNTQTICPDPDHSSPEWICHHFSITQSELNSSDFYVITVPIGDNSPSWIIDRPERAFYSVNREKFSSTPINVTRRISNLLGNDSRGVLWFHVRTPGNRVRNFDAYVVSVPKGTPQSQVSVNNYPEPWFLILQVWY